MNVLITRAAEQCWETVNLLSAEQFRPYCLPMIETVPLAPRFESSCYDYLLFTSPSAVRWFAPHRDKITAQRYIAVGRVTAEKIASLFRIPAGEIIVPGLFSADGLTEKLSQIDLSGKTILAPGPLVRSKDLSGFFKEKGAVYEPAAIYKTVPVIHEINPDDFFAKYRINVVCFFSPSAVNAFFMQAKLPGDIVVAAIGGTTASALRAHGVNDFLMPADYTAEGIVSILKELRSGS